MPKKVEDCLDRANQLRQSGELDEAIAVYQRAIKLDPNSYQSYHYMGETLAQKGELEAAANSYNLALEINPDFFWSYHCLGKVLLEQGKLDEAVSAARQALELEPKRAVLHYQLGLYLEHKLELNGALVAYVQALELEPNLTEARHHLEAILARQAESPADLKSRDLTAKKEQEGIDLETLLAQGRDLMAKGDIDKAIAIYQQGIELDANSYEGYHFLGEALAKKNELETAEKCYRQAIEINPDYYWSYHCLGLVLFWQGELEEAIAATRQAIAIEPNKAVFHYQLGQYLEQKLDLDRAIAAYSNALELEPNLTEARHHLEAVLAQKAESPADLKPRDLTAKKEQEGIYVETLLAQGRDLMAKGDIDKAIAVYQRAIELDPNSYETYHYMGETLAQKGDLDAATNFYLLALEINPEFFWSYHCLGLTLLWQGKYDEAIACFEKAIAIEPNRPEFHDRLRLARAEKKAKKIAEPLDIESLIKQGNEGIYSRIAERFYWKLKTKAHEPIPPQKLINYSGSNNIPHYIDNMLLYSKDIIQQCMLKRNHKVLEIGCGAGRIANGLFHYLNKEGEYLGIDVNPEIINWCNNFITTRNGNFQFKQVPVVDNYYYEQSNNKVNNYDFSFLGDREFDCAIAVSTFNHLRREDAQQYLQEIGKRLKPKGVAYFTFFIIDRCFMEFRKRTKLHQGLKKHDTGVWYGYEGQSSFTGYEIETLKEMLDDANLQILTYHPGSWAQKKRSRLFQDWLLVERKY